MEKIVIKSEYNIDKFLSQYENDLKYIYKSLTNERLIDLIDIVNIKDLKIINNKKEKNNIKEYINSKDFGIALIIGGICDDNVTFFRAIDGVQYRIAKGECYEETSENFHDYKTVESLIETGDMKFTIESSYCMLLYLENESLNIELVEVDLYDNIYKCNIIKESKELGKIINKYIIKNIY